MPNTTLQHEKVFCENCGKEPIAISTKYCPNCSEKDFVPPQNELLERANTQSVLMVCRVCRHDTYNKPGYDEEKSCKYCAEPELRKSFVEYYSYKWLPNGSKRTLQSPDIESLRR